MTQEQQDAAWRSLPEDYKEEVCKDYANAKAVHELDPTNERIDMHIIFLEKYFGKHNLTATEEEKPLRSITNGDKVIILSEPFTGIYGEVNDFVFDEGKVFVQVVTKIGEKLIEPQKLEIISSATQDCEKSIENGMSKETAEELAKCLAELDDSINKFKTSQVDWLAYRMELAKDTLRYITSCSTPQEMKANELADYVMTTIDGIVERLKGGEK